jgi:hypothetical protein
VDGIVSRLKRLGMDWVAIKAADGRHAWRNRYTLDDVARIRAEAGVRVLGWTYVYGEDLALEIAAIDSQAKRLGLDGVIIDAEAELRDSGRAGQWAEQGAKVLNWLPRAWCPLPVTWGHSGLRFDVWDANGWPAMPMFYTNVLGRPGRPWAIGDLFELWSRYMSGLAPVFGMYGPTGHESAAVMPTAAEVAEFAQACNLAGCEGRSYWRLDLVDEEALMGGDPPGRGPVDPMVGVRTQLDSIWGNAGIVESLGQMRDTAASLRAAVIAIKDHLGMT